MSYLVEDKFAGSGDHRMMYTGSVEAKNQFDRVCHEHRFEDEENGTQASLKTGIRFLPETELSKLMESMFDTKFKTGDTVDPKTLVGKEFDITIKEVNGFTKVTKVSPATTGEE